MQKNKLEFHEVGHEYKINGQLIPSVSEVVGLLTENIYKDIPKSILDNAAKFGTDVHKFIQLYNETGIIEFKRNFKMYHCLNEWIRLSSTFDEIIENELMVHFMDLYAGTFDSVARIGKDLVLIDYKTTNKFHKKNVTLQLNLYKIAYEWMTGKKIKKLCCVWLPKHRKGKLIFLDILEEYELIEEVIEVLEGGANA